MMSEDGDHSLSSTERGQLECVLNMDPEPRGGFILGV